MALLRFEVLSRKNCSAIFNEKGLRLVILNPSLLLGSGDDRLSSTNVVLDFMARKFPYTPSGGINFVDVRDAADAFFNALTKGRHCERYLLGAVNWTVEEFFRRLEILTGVQAPALRVPKKLAITGSNFISNLYGAFGWTAPFNASEVEMGEYFWYFDSSKAEKELGFKARDPMETLQDTVKYLRKNFLGEDVFSR